MPKCCADHKDKIKQFIFFSTRMILPVIKGAQTFLCFLSIGHRAESSVRLNISFIGAVTIPSGFIPSSPKWLFNNKKKKSLFFLILDKLKEASPMGNPWYTTAHVTIKVQFARCNGLLVYVNTTRARN